MVYGDYLVQQNSYSSPSMLERAFQGFPEMVGALPAVMVELEYTLVTTLETHFILAWY